MGKPASESAWSRFGRCLFLSLAGVATAWALTASAAPFATLRWTNPRFNAAVDESGRAYCEIGPDTCRDLHSVEVWGIPTYGGQARKLLTVSVWGREGRIDSAAVDREANWIGWHYWIVPVDMGAHRGCSSNVVFVPGSAITGVDLPEPSPLMVAQEVWFDVQGRKLKGRPTGSGVYFLAWRVRGVVQKPAHKVAVRNGVMLNPPLPRWALER